MAGNVQKREAPTLLRERLEVRPDENLDGLSAGVDLDTNSLVAKVDFMASSILPSNDGVGHYGFVAFRSIADERETDFSDYSPGVRAQTRPSPSRDDGVDALSR